MIINNKLDKSFGPGGSFAGYFMLIAGLFAWPFGLIVSLLGAFMAFSTTGTMIDTVKREIKFYNAYFGIFHKGTWESMNKYSHLVVERTSGTYRMYSRANNVADVRSTDYRVKLVETGGKYKTDLMKCKTAEEAKSEAAKLSKILSVTYQIQ